MHVCTHVHTHACTRNNVAYRIDASRCAMQQQLERAMRVPGTGIAILVRATSPGIGGSLGDPSRGPPWGPPWDPPKRGSRGAPGGPRGAPGCTFFWVFNNSPSRDRFFGFYVTVWTTPPKFLQNFPPAAPRGGGENSPPAGGNFRIFRPRGPLFGPPKSPFSGPFLAPSDGGTPNALYPVGT